MQPSACGGHAFDIIDIAVRRPSELVITVEVDCTFIGPPTCLPLLCVLRRSNVSVIGFVICCMQFKFSVRKTPDRNGCSPLLGTKIHTLVSLEDPHGNRYLEMTLVFLEPESKRLAEPTSAVDRRSYKLLGFSHLAWARHSACFVTSTREAFVLLRRQFNAKPPLEMT
jgi:hypothetical protein